MTLPAPTYRGIKTNYIKIPITQPAPTFRGINTNYIKIPITRILSNFTNLKNQHFVRPDKQAVLLVKFDVLVFWWQLNCYWDREKRRNCKSADMHNGITCRFEHT